MLLRLYIRFLIWLGAAPPTPAKEGQYTTNGLNDIKNSLWNLLFTIVVIVFFCTIIGMVAAGLQSCGWLDNSFLKHSGCLFKLEYGDAIAFSPDGTVLATSSYNNIKLWDVKEGIPLSKIEDKALSGGIAFSPDGNILAKPSAGSVKLWQVKNGKLLSELTVNDGLIVDVDFSADGVTVAAITRNYNGPQFDNKILIWKLGGSTFSDGSFRRTLAAYQSYPEAIEFSPDGKNLASATLNSVRLWQVDDGTLLYTLNDEFEEVRDIAFSPDGSKLAIANGRTVELREVKDGKLLNRFKEGDFINGIAFSPDGALIATVSHTAKIWSATDGELLHTIQAPNLLKLTYWDVAFSPDGQLLATAQESSPTKLYRLE